MLSAIAIIPSAPVLVPEIARSAAAELTALRAAVLEAAATLPQRWVGVGVGDCAGASVATVGSCGWGTFAGYGVDLHVALVPGLAPSLVPTDRPWPLCALIAGWVRGQVDPGIHAEVRAFADSHDAESAVALGGQLRAELDATPAEVGLLVVADGAHALTAAAPAGYDPSAVDAQLALDTALAHGDAPALARLPRSIVGRVAYQVLAGIAPAPRSATVLCGGAPYGVGYFAGVWAP